MIFRPGSIFIFAGITLGLTWIIFPGPATMTRNFMLTGLVAKARTELEHGLQKELPGTELLSTAVDVYLAEGETDLAIRSLEEVVHRHPNNLHALEKLARLLEWTMQPIKSLETYERLLALSPERVDINDRLIHGFRYYGKREKAISLMTQRVLVAGAWNQLAKDPFASSLSTLLQKLARDRIKKGPETLRDHALEQNYLLLEQYRTNKPNKSDQASFITYVFENFLASGLPKLALNFADSLDAKRGTPQGTLLLSNVFQWNAMPGSALEAVIHGLNRFPGHRPLLEEALALARNSATRDSAAITTLLTVLQSSDVIKYRMQAALIEANHSHFEHAVAIAGSLSEPAKSSTLNTILRQVLLEDAPKSLENVVAAVADKAGSDALLTAALAQGYFRLGKIKKSREYWFRALSQAPNAPEDQTQLLREALSGGDYQVTKKTTAILLKNDSPAFRFLLRNAASQLAAREHYTAAYDTLRAVLSASPAPEDLKNLLLWSGYAADTNRLRDASTLTSEYAQNNIKLIRLAAEVNGWLGDGGSPFPFLRILVSRFPCDTRLGAKALAVAPQGEQAASLAKRILSCPSLSPDTAHPALRTLIRDKRQEEAKKFLTPHITHSAPEPDLLAWAAIAEEIGLQDLAFAGYKRLWNTAPDQPEFARRAARLASWTGRYRERAEILERLAQLNPRRPNLALEAGLALEEVQAPRKALSQYLRVARHAPDTPNLLPRIFRLQEELGLHQERFQLLEATQKRRTLTRHEVRYFLEDALRLDRPAEALELVRKLTAGTITDLHDLLPIVRILTGVGQYARARALMEQSKQAIPSSTENLLAMGTAALQYDFLQTALSCFKQVLNAEPSNAAALKGSAMIHAAKNQPGRAITLFRRYLRLHPDDAGARFQLGELLFANGRREEAHTEYARVKKAVRTTSFSTP